MPLIFIHGVNTRDTDPDYFIGKEARRKQFDDVVAVNLRKHYPGFQVLDDIYWGDLGVRFRWELQSVPETKALESLGPEATQFDNPALLQLIANTPPAPSATGAAQSNVLVRTFVSLIPEKSAGDVVRSLFAPEAGLFDPPSPAPPGTVGNVEQLKAEGEQLSILLRAASNVARKVDQDPSVVGSPVKDEDLLNAIKNLVYQEQGELMAAEPTEEEHLGRVDDAKAWAVNRLSALVDGAKAVVSKVRNEPARAATLLAMQGFRDQVSNRSLRFLGDVFVYLYQGYTGEIAVRVRDGVRAAWKIAVDREEPLIIVTHSFGSEILYDALTSSGLDDIKIKLWASAGAQTSLFAEMALYQSSDSKTPTPPPPAIPGKPAQVEKWINFFDAADVLSYLHRPVFKDVEDIEVRFGGNISNAHGHYFVTPEFYEGIDKALS